MGWFGDLFGGKTKKPKIDVTESPDGSRTVQSEFELSGDPRPVRDEVVVALDDALAALGGEVMHAMDPSRLLDFDQGGPPVWSVGLVEVPGEAPYTLLVTYGFSHVLSPADFRDGIRHEYSIAVPANVDPTPWADALLRHLSRYVLSTGRDLEPGQVMPCYAPITYVPFQPDDHASMPATDLVGLVVAPDPVLSSVSTPNGDIEIRRFLGVHQAELDRAETWSATAFAEEYRQRDPLLLTDLGRADAMDDTAFRTRVDKRAEQEGSEMPSLLLDVYWQDSPTELAIEFPGGPQAQKLLDALHGRLSFGKPLTVIARQCPPIHFVPDASFDINWSPQGLVLQGTLDDPNIAEIVKFIRPDAPGAVVRLPLA